MSIRLLLFLLFLVLSVEAEHVRWFGNFEKAHQEALKTDKFLFVLLVEEFDSMLLKKSFMNQSYIKELNEKYISVLIKKDQKESYPIEMLYTTEYPSVFILDKHELYICDALRADLSAARLKAYLQKCN